MIFICDQIYQRGSYMHIMARPPWIATLINKQYTCVYYNQQLISLLLLWLVSEVYVSHVHKHLSCCHLTLLAFDENSPSCKSPHDWLVMLSIDLTTCCGIYRLNTVQLGPFRSVISWHIVSPPLPWLSTATTQPPLCKHLWYWWRTI